jgi:peptidoglycan/xylan/chitin deacetylase (PgdA/CDA1 family)
MQWLQANFDLVSLEEAQRRVRSGINARQAVSVTFDDGYAENCRFALPLMKRMGIPCTYFVSLAHVVHGTPFPHDSARGEPLAPNTVEELRAMADSGVEIGAHTRTHADLGRLNDRVALHDEVVVASEELQHLLGRPVRYFSFPYGLHANLNRQAFDLAFETGFEAVCSAYGGYNFPGDDPFHLQRIGVDGELLRLKNWLSLDARKLRGVRRFEYETFQAPAPRESIRA